MGFRGLPYVVLALAVIGPCALAQQQPPVVRHVPIKETSPVSGKKMFAAYCATCHGTNGEGNGPAASALKVPPTNLTLLSKTNGGMYPSAKVRSVLNGTSNLAAHGSKDMPVWGQLFWAMSHGSTADVQLRVQNLTSYIESLQKK